MKMDIYNSFFKNMAFSSSVKFKLPFTDISNNDRISILKKLVSNKKIIHLGCADHLELIENKIKTGNWLHKHLVESAHRVLGIDIDMKSIDYIKNKLGYDNVLCKDIVNEKITEIISEEWDYLVMGEILEHIDNPVEFLKVIREKYSENIKSVILTVPNAFFIDNFFNVLEDSEVINSDHRYWFTPFTLSKIMIQAGIEPKDIYMCQRHTYHTKSLRFKKIFKKWILKKHPLSRNTIIEIGELNTK